MQGQKLHFLLNDNFIGYDKINAAWKYLKVAGTLIRFSIVSGSWILYFPMSYLTHLNKLSFQISEPVL